MSVTVSEAKDLESGVTGEYSYKISYGTIDRGWSNYTTNKTYRFENIYGDFLGVDCKIEVKTRDKVGNERIIEKIAKTTGFNTNFYKNISSRNELLLLGK